MLLPQHRPDSDPHTVGRHHRSILLQPTRAIRTHLQRRGAERKHNLRRSADEAAQIDEHVHATPIDRRRCICGTLRAEVSPRLGRFLDPLLPLRPVRAAPESAGPSGCSLDREEHVRWWMVAGWARAACVRAHAT